MIDCVKKVSKNMGELIIKEIDYYTAKNMIIENHYSHKWNTAFGKINIGIFKDDVLYGCAVFGNLMNPKSYKNINKNFTKYNVIELNRLWIDDCLGKNAETILLGACWKIIRENYPDIKCVQSFADGRLGCGTIYKASNFKYYGYTKTLFYRNKITGIVYHKVPMENTKRPDGLIKLNSMYCNDELEPFYVKTYRYIYPLYKNVKIDLCELSYPKYDKGEIAIKDYKHNKLLVFRAWILSYCLGYKEYKVFDEYIKDMYSKNEIFENINKAVNKSVVSVCESRGVKNILDDFVYKYNTI